LISCEICEYGNAQSPPNVIKGVEGKRRRALMRSALLVAVLAVFLGAGAFLAEGRTDAGVAEASPEPVSRAVMAPVAMPALNAGDTAGVAAASSAAVDDAVRAVDAVHAANPGTEIGAAVLDRKTGRLALGSDGTTQFYSASVVKLYTVVAILHKVEAGQLTLTATDRDDIQRALIASDDNAMDALWVKFGGAQTVTQTISLVGLKDSKPPVIASQWGETKISARDVTAVYNYVLRSMSPTSRNMIMDALGHAQDKGADGFDQAFGLIAPPRQSNVAAKQGWMWIKSDFDLHTTGVLGGDDRYVVVILSKNPANSGSAAARTIVNKATSAAEAALPQP
jgi:hypothetical protein